MGIGKGVEQSRTRVRTRRLREANCAICLTTIIYIVCKTIHLIPIDGAGKAIVWMRRSLF